MKKYVFKPYSKIFPQLFQKEKERILSHINQHLIIEHIGSTAVPELGGKGIIDIAIAISKKDMETVSKQIQAIGYEFRPTFSTPDRFYFINYLTDLEEENRRYHIHLTYPENNEWREFLGFRDHLKSHPKEAQEYAKLKQHAVIEANGEGDKYRELKETFFKKKCYNYHFEYQEDPVQEDEKVLFEGITHEAMLKKKMDRITPFGVFIKNFQGVVFGGINGFSCYGCLYIDMLWLKNELRKQGLGKKLMMEAEKIGRERQCTFATVDTMDWEALFFYQKLGYSIEFVRQGFEKESKMYMLRKKI